MPFPEDPTKDPAFAPLAEAGQGESEGFELAEAELIEHTEHGDSHGTGVIGQHADTRSEEETGAVYGDADDEHPQED